jgi:tetratricopeptide (TPR) repeat protein
MDSRVPATEPAESRDGAQWPVRSGPVPPLADGFSGRPETAPSLGAALVPGTAVVLVPGAVAADGSRGWLGSCGKTQLAVHFAESLWQSGGADLLVWVAATSRASVLSSYVTAATAAMGTDPAGDAEAVAARFVGWLATTSRSWLVVLDDLSDAADVEGLWPEGPSGRVLVTTGNAAALRDEHRALTLPVGVFSSREALSYLMGRLTGDPDQRLGAIDLVKDLSGEPLALAQASGVIASLALSCRDYRDYFAQRRARLAERAGGELPAAAVTWTFSVEQGDRLSPDGTAQALLALASLLDAHGMPAAIFTTSAAGEYLTGVRGDAATDRERIRRALLVLDSAGLLTGDPATGPVTIRMNPVVQAAVRTAMPDEMLDRAARGAADGLLELWPEDEGRAWQDRALRSCAASLQRSAGHLLWTSGCHPLLMRAGRSLDSARLTGPAVEYWRDLAAAADRLLGPDHQDTLTAGEALATAYLAAGRPAEAVPWSQWVLSKRLRVLGPDHPGAISARRNLGHALVAADLLDDAISVLDVAVADYGRVCGSDHLDTLGARDELAAAYRAAGQFANAIKLCQRTLADRERIQGPRNPDTINTRQQLASAYQADGRVKDALAQYKRVAADREKVLGPDHLDTIAARGNLGSAYHSAGRMASALQFYEQAREGLERVLGADHPDALARRANLANAYFTAGRLTDATVLLRDTVERCERVLPPGDPLTQAVRESLTNIAGG